MLNVLALCAGTPYSRLGGDYHSLICPDTALELLIAS